MSTGKSPRLYGNRLSHGLVPLDHTMPPSPLLDTAGLLTRDSKIWKEAAQALYGSTITVTDSYPKSIKTVDWATSGLASNVADQFLIDFRIKVANFSGH